MDPEYQNLPPIRREHRDSPAVIAVAAPVAEPEIRAAGRSQVASTEGLNRGSGVGRVKRLIRGFSAEVLAQGACGEYVLEGSGVHTSTECLTQGARGKKNLQGSRAASTELLIQGPRGKKNVSRF